MTPFEEIYERFSYKIKSRTIALLPKEVAEEGMESYLMSSIASFTHCHKDLSDLDMESKHFNVELTNLEKEILAVKMTYEWTGGHVLSEENMMQRLGSKDYQNFSPANHLEKLLDLRASIDKEISKLINSHYYAGYGG